MSDRPLGASAPVRLESVGYSIGDVRILDEVSLSVGVGETVALVGRSGSGKTSALKLINRLREPTRGRVLVQGRSTLDWDPIQLRRRIGYVIQEIGLFPHLDVSRNVGLVPELEGRESDWIAERTRELLELVGLDPDAVWKRRPGELSGGQRQRVGVARALAADPPILLMDEPFGALDPITRRELQAEFIDLQRRLQKTIVLVTHDVREAQKLGNRIALMEAGSLVWLGPVEEFLSSSDERIQHFREEAE